MYRQQHNLTSSTATFELPDYFQYLAKDVIVLVSPFEHFGSGWGSVMGNQLQLHVTTLGLWNVLVTGARKDPCALQCDRRIEYQRDIQE